jgi:hypothetical protein
MERKKMKQQNKKLSLQDIKVQSFVTTLEEYDQEVIKGGTSEQNMRTLVPVLC